MCMDLSIYYNTTVQILLIRGSKQLDKLNYAEPTRAQKHLLYSLRRVHRDRCEKAISRLRAEILRQVVHLKIGQALAEIKERRRLEQPVLPSPSSGDEDDSAPEVLRLGQALALLKERPQMPNAGPDGASPSVADEEGQAPDPPETVTHWQRHYPWDFVTPMALNSRGEQIYYRVDSDQDRMWAWRMERAVDHHMAVRERDLAEQREDHEMKMAEGRRRLFMTAGVHF
jgi:hypothetical protein